MADKRITDVDFIDSLDGSESFFINQNSSIKQVNRGNAFKDTVWSVANGGTGASDAATARANLGITLANIGAQTKHNAVLVELLVDSWVDNQQIVSVSGVTVDNTVFISPDGNSYKIYAENGVYCSGQSMDSLTFSCESVPNNVVTVNVAIFE